MASQPVQQQQQDDITLKRSNTDDTDDRPRLHHDHPSQHQHRLGHHHDREDVAEEEHHYHHRHKNETATNQEGHHHPHHTQHHRQMSSGDPKAPGWVLHHQKHEAARSAQTSSASADKSHPNLASPIYNCRYFDDAYISEKTTSAPSSSCASTGMSQTSNDANSFGHEARPAPCH